ncbi:MAG: outer membrane lipoprotein chaperone LolA [Xanthomonadales bacterium]|jgi:outer membrane lipoprotein carrier protein|nr:outer membrane lipoprotein chaperone LolA [Xanthomonadales bacterium]
MTRIVSAIGLALLCSLSLVLPAAAQQDPAPPGSARAQLNTFSAGLEALHARFEQQVVSTDGAVSDRSSGEVWLQRPQRFRWEYGGDFPEVVVADGERLWIYDEALEQVTVEDQTAGELASPLTLLTDPGRLDEQFAVSEAGEADGLHLLELRAHSAESDFERILLGLRDNALELMIMEDAFGLRTELHFRDVERNPTVDPARFTFTPPEGVDVIGDLAIIRPLN